MKKEVGLWFDNKRAVVIVINLDEEEEIKRIASNLDEDVHPFMAMASHASGESESPYDTIGDEHPRYFDNQLNRYYDEAISQLRDTSSILILCPSEVKVELQKRMEVHGLSDRILAVKTADKMTDVQIAIELRQHFREVQRSSNGNIQHQQEG